jgi:tRNA(Leu) C34 or U34 (ribose-2'-O)-methylase TrmL
MKRGAKQRAGGSIVKRKESMVVRRTDSLNLSAAVAVALYAAQMAQLVE